MGSPESWSKSQILTLDTSPERLVHDTDDEMRYSWRLRGAQ